MRKPYMTIAHAVKETRQARVPMLYRKGACLNVLFLSNHDVHITNCKPTGSC
jgi:hypothetical protein